MKKALIAGAVGTVLAAVPVFGAFAETAQLAQPVDTLLLTVSESCTITRGATSNGHGLGADNPGGAWGTGVGEEGTTGQGKVNHVDTYHATVNLSTQYNALATSNFNVVCNDNDGYQVIVSTNGFSSTSGGATGDNAWNYVAGAEVANSGESMWTILSSETAEYKDLENNIVSKHINESTAGNTFTVTYGAWVDSSQPAATYTATASYNLVQLPAA